MRAAAINGPIKAIEPHRFQPFDSSLYRVSDDRRIFRPIGEFLPKNADGNISKKRDHRENMQQLKKRIQNRN